MKAAIVIGAGLGADGVLLHRDGVPFDSAKFDYEVRAARRCAGLAESISFHDLTPRVQAWSSVIDKPPASLRAEGRDASQRPRGPFGTHRAP